MTTIIVWLLVSVGHNWSHAIPTNVVERFPTAEDCEATAVAIRDARELGKPILRCVQARVVKP